MDSFKLDKIDKIVISAIFIISALFSFFNTFVFASSGDALVSVPAVFSEDFRVSNGLGYISSSGPFSLFYYPLSSDTDYLLKNISTSGGYTLGFADSIEEGSSIHDLFSLPANSSYYFSTNDYNYLFLIIPGGSNVNYTELYSVYKGFSESIDSLTSNVSGQLIWDSIESALPFILVCTVFGLGTVFIHRLIKSGSRGKAKLF